jgi:hypothetical protein
MIAGFTASGLRCVDLETACLYALGERLGIAVAALHIVTDNPVRKTIDREHRHEAAFRDQILAAAAFGRAASAGLSPARPAAPCAPAACASPQPGTDPSRRR